MRISGNYSLSWEGHFFHASELTTIFFTEASLAVIAINILDFESQCICPCGDTVENAVIQYNGTWLPKVIQLYTPPDYITVIL